MSVCMYVCTSVSLNYCGESKLIRIYKKRASSTTGAKGIKFFASSDKL